MNFTIKDRLIFIQHINTERESLLKEMIKASILSKLNLTPIEIDTYLITETETGISWENNTYTKEIVFSDCEIKYLKTIVELLEEKDMINYENIDICSEIIEK